jgi:hypothetical protein
MGKHVIIFFLVTFFFASCSKKGDKTISLSEWKKIEGKWYLIDNKGIKIYTTGYDSIAEKEFVFDLFIEENLLLQDYKIFKTIFDDEKDTLDTATEEYPYGLSYFSDKINQLSNRTKVYERKDYVLKVGLIANGKLILSTQYEGINTKYWSDNIIVVLKIYEPNNALEAVYDTLGNEKMPFKYTSLYYLGKDYFITNYRVKNEKKGVVNSKSEIVYSIIYDSIEKINKDSLKLQKGDMISYSKI